MKKRYLEEQIAYALRQAESGVAISELCRTMGISEQTFYNWKSKYAGRGWQISFDEPMVKLCFALKSRFL